MEHAREEALRGRTPRHVLDVSLDSDALDARYEGICRELLARARSASGEICARQDRQYPELSAVEEAGLSGRMRYLVTVACVAAAVDTRLGSDAQLDRLAYLKTIHRVLTEWREEATYDLSNVLGPLEFLPVVGRPLHEILGTWIWLNLGDAGEHRHLTWVKSTMRFGGGYGREIRSRFAPEKDADARTTAAAAPERASGISRDQARKVAEEHLADTNVLGATGQVRRVAGWEEGDWRDLNIYGYDDYFWRSHWIVYLEQEGHALRSSLVLAVHRETGAIDYVGRASDEG